MAKKDVELRFSIKDGVSAGLKSIQQSVDSVAGSLAKFAPAATAAGAAIAGVAAAAAFKNGVAAAADFESALGRISAKSGETGAALDQIKTGIETIAAESSKSVGQAAAAFETLAGEGFNASEAMKALPAALDLATVSGRSTEEAAGALAATLDQFGLSASDAAKSADTLASAALGGGTGVDQLLQAFEQVGPTARNAGLSLNETASALAALAQNGIEGGRAGGALRAILDGLADPASTFSKELAKIGVTSRDFGTVVQQLAAKGDAASAAFNALGSRGTAALQALARDGGAAMAGLESKIAGAQGSLAAFAGIINTDFNTALANLQNALTDAQRKFLEPLLTPLANELRGLEKQIRDFTASKDFAELRTAFETTFKAGIAAVKDFLAEFDFSKALRDVREFSQGASKALADLSDQADKLATAYKLVKGAVEIIPNALNSAANAAGGAAAKIGAAVNAPLEAIGITAADTSRKLDSLGNDAFANVQEDANSFGDTLRLLGTTLFGIGDTAKEAGNKTDAAGAGFDRLGASAKGAGDKAAEAGEKIAGAGSSIATIPKSVEKVANSVDELEKQLSAMQQQFDLAKSIGASPEKLAELQRGIDDTRKKLKDLADASAALNKPLVETPQDGARAFEALGSAAGSAADDIEATGEAAQQSALMAAEGTASLSGITAALFAKYSALSEAAGRFFAESLRAANFGSLSLQSYGRAIEAADRATQQAFDNQVAGAGSAIAALEQFAQTGAVAGDTTATAFYRSEQSLDAMSVAIQQGVGGFELLDSQTLSRLQGAIDAARQKTQQLSDDARAAAAELAAIGDQLEDQALRDSGNEAEIARRELERRIKNIEEIEKRAGAAGAAEAERAKRLAREEYERKIQDIQNAKDAQMQADKAAADARIAENQRVWDADPYNPNSTAQTATAAGETSRSTGAIGTSRQRGQVPAEGINVQFNFDKGASIFTSQRQAEEVARLMLRELERLQRRKR